MPIHEYRGHIRDRPTWINWHMICFVLFPFWLESSLVCFAFHLPLPTSVMATGWGLNKLFVIRRLPLLGTLVVPAKENKCMHGAHISLPTIHTFACCDQVDLGGWWVLEGGRVGAHCPVGIKSNALQLCGAPSREEN